MRYLFMGIVFWVLILFSAIAEATEWGPYPAMAIHVVDGDTFDVYASVAPEIMARWRVRLDKINTPEKTGSDCEKKAGKAATEFTARWLAEGGFFLTVTDRDKYGRFLAKAQRGNEDLATLLIKRGHARPYAGEKRGPWCNEGVKG